MHGFVTSLQSFICRWEQRAYLMVRVSGRDQSVSFKTNLNDNSSNQQTAAVTTAAAASTTTSTTHFARYPHAEMAELYETTSGIIPYDGIS